MVPPGGSGSVSGGVKSVEMFYQVIISHHLIGCGAFISHYLLANSAPPSHLITQINLLYATYRHDIYHTLAALAPPIVCITPTKVATLLEFL